MNIQMPYITGKSLPEQLAQIVAYLRYLAQVLQQLPQAVPQTQQPAAQETVRGNVFDNLRVRKQLLAEGGVNGTYTRQVKVWSEKSFQLQSKFTKWDTAGEVRQSFLVSGSANGTPVLGVVVLNSNGAIRWQGSEGVSVTAGTAGVITVELSQIAYDYLLVQSPELFQIV